MNTEKTISSIKKEYSKNILESNFLSLKLNGDCIQVVNEEYLEIFNALTKGQSFEIAKLSGEETIKKQMSDYLSKVDKKNILFSNLKESDQQERLETLKERIDESYRKDSYGIGYFAFATLHYQIEGQDKKAPLVFVPVSLNYNKEDDTYVVCPIAKEVRLNEALISYLKDQCRIDLSYPVNKDFSISEYVYYCMVKVKNINWYINNLNFIGLFDFSNYDNYVNILEHEKEIEANDLVKRLSYFNSEFYRFNSLDNKPLDVKYLSLLEMDSEEYNLLRVLTNKENYFLRIGQDSDSNHLLGNIVSTYLLNNKRILIAYSNEEQVRGLKKVLDKNYLSKFYLDLNMKELKKEESLVELSKYDDYVVPYNKLHKYNVDADVSSYYDYKNNYRNLVNSLRSNKNPLKTSINKLVNNYYALEDVPLINAEIKNADYVNLDQLKNYLNLITQFEDALDHLGTELNKHPFYGFNKKVMRKEDYQPLKDILIPLSNSLLSARNIYSSTSKTYNLPKVNNLREMKALLNILSFAEYFKDKDIGLLKVENLDQEYDKLKENVDRVDVINKAIEEMTATYSNKLLELSDEDLAFLNEEKINGSKLNRARKYIKANSSIPKNEAILVLRNYKELKEEKDELLTNQEFFPISIRFYKTLEETKELRKIIDNINTCRYNCDYLHVEDKDFLYNLVNNNISQSSSRKKMQELYNEILNGSKRLQEYFDETKVSFEDKDITEYLILVKKMIYHFSSINDYTNYLLRKHEFNKSLDKVADELELLDKGVNKQNVFLKRFYFDVLKENLNKDTLRKYSREDILSFLNEFNSSDERRKELIQNVIINNYNSGLRNKLQDIKQNDGNTILSLLKSNASLYPLRTMSSELSETISNFRPCILVPIKEVSNLLKSENYQFENAIILSRRSDEIKDVLPILARSNRIIVVDEQRISLDPRSNIFMNLSQSSLIENARKTYREVEYLSNYRKELELYKSNQYDLDFKIYLKEKLASRGLEVGINRQIEGMDVDLLVRVKDAPTSIAILVDHLPYSSPEIAYRNFSKESAIIYNHNYYPYRIFPFAYFKDEEHELNKLVDFIVEKSHLMPEVGIRKKTILLTNKLFEQYDDPRKVYYNLEEKTTLKNKVLRFVKETSPILESEIHKVFIENTSLALEELVRDNYIERKEGFILYKDKEIKFRRIDRQKDFYRPLETVYKEEIHEGMKEILKNKENLTRDTLIKMVLLALGYKKMNKNLEASLNERIEELISQGLIKEENNLLNIKK